MQKILNTLMMNIWRSFFVAIASILLVAGAATANAQTAPSPLGVPLPAQSEAPAAQNPSPGATHSVGPMTRMWNWLLATQSKLNRDMAAAVRGLKSDDPLRAAMVLIGIAFAYGVLHAAGPGHGKAVISAYVLANHETVRRGIALSFLSAFVQALSAIVFVGIMVLILQQTSIQMRSAEATIETVSWGLVAVVGAYLLYRQIAPFLAAKPVDAHHQGKEHSQNHAHGKSDHHSHGPNCGCGHSHMPAPQDLQGAWSWRRALPLALSVGIRPCSGAILLLIFALSQGMLWAGIIGTFAMALGTAITVSVLATLAVTSRDWAAKTSGPGSVWAERFITGAGFVGAGLVFVLGTVFFIGSLKGPTPF